ncbi:MAG: hypothetical protein COB37_00440 [Kordiimonadales bacterium]|nr:MAG: hypothetical protein COB37_00440 [Kordiimonadales bacterium]
MKQKIKNMVVSAALVIAGSVAGAAQDDGLAEKFAQVVGRYGDYQVFQGAVLVAKDGEVLYAAGTGLANREWGAPNDPTVKYKIASLTKGFTAALILKLVEEGKLSLTDTILDHFPDYKGDQADIITIDLMLRHMAGMQHTTGLPGWFTGHFRRDISDTDFIKEIEKLPLLSEPGERYGYSNLDYFLLGKMAELVTGETYAEALKSRIFSPLNMTDTGVDTADALLAKRASGYVWAAGGGYRNQGWSNMDVFGGGAALYSTAEDLLKWQQGLMAGKILSADSMALMFAADSPIGWRVQPLTLPNGKAVSTTNYDGQIDGFSSMLTHFTDSNLTVVLLGNIGTDFQAKRQLTLDLAAVFLAGFEQRKLPLSYHLTKALSQGQLAEGIEGFWGSKGSFAADERRIESFADQIGWAQMPARSLMVRELSVKLFPASARALAVLGNTQSRMGDKDAAAASYQKAIVVAKKAEQPDMLAYIKGQLAGLGQ